MVGAGGGIGIGGGGAIRTVKEKICKHIFVRYFIKQSKISIFISAFKIGCFGCSFRDEF
jgi:hypothetical protein